jgi:hypothetical protein
MAIFSLNHTFIGRTTHPAGSASLFARYITRDQACTEVVGARMPTERAALMAWLDEQEQSDRKNARVIDKVVVALPKELTHAQNVALLEAYGERMTQGRASWVAAIHDGPGDADNPHAHIIFRDRDAETGKRVMMTTEKGSTGQFREGWEEEVNRALEREGIDERVDRRSLKDQGVDREPQLHVGAGAEKLRNKQHEFQSAQVEITRTIDGVPTQVTVNYPVIDQGKTRFEENEARKARNAARELAMDGIFSRDTELQELYHKALQGEADDAYAHAKELTSIRGALEQRERDHAFSDETTLQQLYYQALQDEAAPSEDEFAAWVVSRHIALQEIRRTEQNRLDALSGDPNDDLDGKPARKGLTDLIGGGGLAIVGKIADSIETIFDGPRKLAPDQEQELSMGDKEKIDAMRREQAQRQPVQDEAARKAALDYQAWLNERARQRGIDRGR